MSDLFDNSSFSKDNDKGIDPELAELLMVEKQKAQFNAQVNIYIYIYILEIIFVHCIRCLKLFKCHFI